MGEDVDTRQSFSFSPIASYLAAPSLIVLPVDSGNVPHLVRDQLESLLSILPRPLRFWEPLVKIIIEYCVCLLSTSVEGMFWSVISDNLDNLAMPTGYSTECN